jgi:hypothetical protein
VKVTRPVNPYQFEPDTPEIMNVNRQTHITDFMRKHESSPASFSSPRMGHFKNARSAGSAVDVGETLRPLAYDAQKSAPFRLQRCGSSPQIGNMKYPAWGGEEPEPEFLGFVDDYGYRGPSSRQHHELTKTVGPQRGRQYTKDYTPPVRRDSPSSRYRDGQKFASTSTAGTSSTIPSQTYGIDATPKDSPYGRHYIQSPTRATPDNYKQGHHHAVHPVDRNRFPIESSSPGPSPSPPKRSRSPMKRLFGNQTSSTSVSSRKLWGEHGFFGESLPETAVPKRGDHQETIRSRAASNPANQPKKTGIITRVKNKLEEFVSLSRWYQSPGLTISRLI